MAALWSLDEVTLEIEIYFSSDGIPLLRKETIAMCAAKGTYVTRHYKPLYANCQLLVEAEVVGGGGGSGGLTVESAMVDVEKGEAEFKSLCESLKRDYLKPVLFDFFD